LKENHAEEDHETEEKRLILEGELKIDFVNGIEQ
jgi:hypothetical protein